MRCVAGLVALTGCSSLFGLHEPARGVADAPGNSTDAMSDGMTCIGRGAFTICLDAAPTASVTLMNAISTDDAQLCSTTAHWSSSTQMPACMIVGTSILASGSTVVTGSRPLVLIASDVLQVEGVIDVSSSLRTPRIGAGAANAATCGPFGSSPQLSGNGGGGGAGGSFVSAGGSGGRGDNLLTIGGTPGAVAASKSILRGGCRGQVGAPGQGASLAIPGDGGGAVYLVAGGQVVLQGARILANGAGALGGANRAGGSGGGAGGMIVLDAPAISASSTTLMANGGGGSAGADGTVGSDGQDPSSTSPLQPAAGGSSGKGGPGGAGAAGMLPPLDGGDTPSGTSRGGGGGGGGIGLIVAPQALSGATVSPPITLLP